MLFTSLLDRLKERLKKNVSEDRAIFLTCIGIALVFWLMVKMSNSYLTDKLVLFSFALPENKAFTVYPPEHYHVEIRGTGWGLMYEFFANPKIRLHYDLEDEALSSLSQMRLKNDIGNHFAANEIEISEFNYNGFSVALEDRVEKDVPVQLARRVGFANNYRQKDSIIVEPRQIRISGPGSIVNEIEYWPTDSLVLQELNTSVHRQLDLPPPPKEITISHSSVEVDIPVEQYTEKTFLIPVQVKNATDSLKIFPEKIKLACIIGLSQYNQVSSRDFVLEVDLQQAGHQQEQNTVPVLLTQYSPLVSNVSYFPRAVEYFFIRQDSIVVKQPD